MPKNKNCTIITPLECIEIIKTEKKDKKKSLKNITSLVKAKAKAMALYLTSGSSFSYETYLTLNHEPQNVCRSLVSI